MRSTRLVDIGCCLSPVMDAIPAAPASQLLEANDRLLKLRAELQAQLALEQEGGVDPLVAPRRPLPGADSPPDQIFPYQIFPWLAQGAVSLPAHLGWESQPLMAVLRRSGRPVQTSVDTVHPVVQETMNLVEDAPRNRLRLTNGFLADKPAAREIKLYPDIGLGMLRRDKTAAGRLWLMLRLLDREGSGQLRVDIIRNQLAAKSSDLYLCGKRQLRNLLQAGDGLYWTRGDERVWLHSAARVAASLGVAQLTGHPVALPLTALLQGIGAFRAHLYAAFHSGRAKDAHERRSAMPIARDTLAGLSGVGRSSQRAYEARLGIQTQANFAIGETATAGRQEERAWRQGQALFALQDYGGQQGRQGKTYLAWQLPNSYAGQHSQRPKGRQKRINRQLQDLVMKGMPGNDGDAVDGRRPVLAVTQKRYYANGRLAGQARRSHEKGNEKLCYWRQPGAGNGRSAIWRSMGQP